jgi:putative ABC transport system substrate-binding protein
MDRRTFIGRLAGGLLVTPRFATAQTVATPTIGFVRTTPSAPFAHLVTAFREGLNETGFVEGQSIGIEYRWADNHLDRLPGFVADLIRRRVTVIVGNSQAAEAAKTATSTTPIVFVTGDDPVTRGLVDNLSRPNGNVTGITFFGGGLLGAKRLELLAELAPKATVIAFLMEVNWPGSIAELPDVEKAARALGRRIVVAKVAKAGELEAAFATIERAGAGALLVSGSPVFSSRRRELVALTARHAIPAMYDLQEYVPIGGLISYAGSIAGAYRQAGVYAGRIVKGAKPSELPVVQPTTFALAINLKTAKALGLTIPQSLLLRADELIQ